MKDAFLTSETAIKTYSGLDDNTAGSYIHQALYDAQFIDLQETIGTSLLNKLIDLVAKSEIEFEENKTYKYLLDNYIQDFLLYGTMSNLSVILSYKLNNFGLTQTTDDHLSVADFKSICFMKDYYKDKQAFYKSRMQAYLVENYTEFPELKDVSLEKMFPNLYSSSNSPLWLGGSYSGRFLGGIDYKDLPNKKKK